MKTAEHYTVVQNGQVIDGTGKPAVSNGCVHLDSGKIIYVGAAVQAPESPPEAEVIDAQGGSILPGLVEAHFHPTYFNVSEL